MNPNSSVLVLRSSNNMKKIREHTTNPARTLYQMKKMNQPFHFKWLDYFALFNSQTESETISEWLECF